MWQMTTEQLFGNYFVFDWDLLPVGFADTDMFRSQQELPGGHNHIELVRQQSRNRGVEAGVKYAEAFRLIPNLGLVRLGTLLGQ